MFWLMVIPCLAYHAAFLAGRARRGLGPSRYGGWAPRWNPAAMILAVLSLSYLAYALAVLAVAGISLGKFCPAWPYPMTPPWLCIRICLWPCAP